MTNNTEIKTTKTIYPQIYAYTLPEIESNTGWVKIGYTDRENVDIRIQEQTHTAAIKLNYNKLWSGAAKFANSDKWFKDKQLHAYLRKFKNIKQREKTEWFYYNGFINNAYTDFQDFVNNTFSKAEDANPQLDYKLRSEQEEAVNMTMNYFNTHQQDEFLWNAKPRFGKTLTTYDLILKMNFQKVLIVTNRPTIANSWFDDYTDFIKHRDHFVFISTADSLKNKAVFTRDDYMQLLDDNQYNPDFFVKQIAFVSLQDLKGAIPFGGEFDKLSWIKNEHWDLLVIDEAHEGVDTIKTDVAFKNIKRNNTLHLSGTPFKQLAADKFSADQIYNWTYTDEQEAKAEWNIPDENNPYESLPQLRLFSYQMSHMIVDEVNKGANIEGVDMDYVFDLNEFFATNDKAVFIHEREIEKWLNSLTHNEKYPFSTKALRDELKHTFWFLNRVDSANALKKMLEKHPVFENYKVILAAGDRRLSDDDQVINEDSLTKVRKAIQTHDKTITLSVGQLTTGVTVPEWTAVLMLSNIKSPALYMQAAFRAQNPWESTDENNDFFQKQNAYVFDFAPERTLIIYDEFANNLSTDTVGGKGTTEKREDKIKRLLNFFPVIAEDTEGKMVELDVGQVLTIPKAIKAQEVVKRGFMSNLLFQNISGIFASPQVREILDQLKPVDQGKVVPRQNAPAIDTKDIQVDDDGKVKVLDEIVIATTEAKFGNKQYDELIHDVVNDDVLDNQSLGDLAAKAIQQAFTDDFKDLAKEQGVTAAYVDKLIKERSGATAREVETIQKNQQIKRREAELEFNRQIIDSKNDASMTANANAAYKRKQDEIKQETQQKLKEVLEEQTKTIEKESTKEILEKAETKKKDKIEDDIRARLRGFARTIPSFLMAYGNQDTTLINFDKQIKDDVFHEVTGITIEQFIQLRDAFNFFDPIVFDESCLEFLRKKQQLANYFDESQTEDIFDYIPPQKTNQIFTPRWVVKMMVDFLEQENPDIWKNKQTTFADLYVKSGLYLTEIVKKLYAGLADEIPNGQARLKHILEHQVYGYAPSEIIYNIAKNFVYGEFTDIDASNLKFKDLTEIAKNEGDLGMKFDVVVGNPPYQEDTKDTSDKPIYHLFIDSAAKVAEKVLLITPARFLFKAGKAPKDWMEKILKDEHMKVVYYNQKSAEVFPDTDIKGGVTITYRNATEIYGSIGTFTPFNELNYILKKVTNTNFHSLNTLLYPATSYKINNVLYIDYPEFNGRVSDSGKKFVGSNMFDILPEVFLDTKAHNDDIKLLGRLNNNRIFKWVNSKYISLPKNYFNYKVILPESNGTGELGERLSAPQIGEKGVGHSQTFISLGAFQNAFEAEALLKYIKSKFLRLLLGTMKITQHNQSKEVWKNVPLQDFTASSDIDWSVSIPDIDQQLYEKYGLDETEIAFIEEKVKPME